MSSSPGTSATTWALRGLGAVTALGAAVSLGAIVEARAGFIRREHTLPILPAGSKDLSILHLSDLHLLPSMKLKSRWIQNLRALEPDLVINTGDNMASRQSFALVMETLEPFFDLPGAFVFGSNDYYGPTWKNPLRYLLPEARRSATSDEDRKLLPAETLAASMRAAGWHDLRNATASLTIKGSRIAMVGVDDPHIHYDELPVTELPSDADLRLGLTHAPYSRVLNDFDTLGIDLVLAGHTHGGQVNLPGYGALVTNCDLPSWRASGLQGWPLGHPDPTSTPAVPWPPLRRSPEALPASRMWVHISAGLGTSPYAPIRLFRRPEASLLTLTAR